MCVCLPFWQAPSRLLTRHLFTEHIKQQLANQKGTHQCTVDGHTRRALQTPFAIIVGCFKENILKHYPSFLHLPLPIISESIILIAGCCSLERCSKMAIL